MKNSLSKTLLCGVMATTFFLINCQKAPSRGIKAKTAGTADAAANKLEGKLSVACTDTYVKEIEKARDAKDKILAIVKSATVSNKTLTEVEKADVTKGRLELIDKNALVIAEIEKMRKSVEGKVVEGCKTANEQHLFSEKIKQMDDLVIDAGKLVGADDEDQRKAVEAKTTRQENVQTTAQFKDGLELVVSEDMAPLMVIANAGGVVYFENGNIIKESASFEKDQSNKSKTICLLTDVSSNQQKIEGLDKVKVLGLGSVKKISLRNEVTFKLGKGDLFLSIKCLIADSKVSKFATEIKNAFGNKLLTEAQRDTELKKSEAVVKATDIRKAKVELVTAANTKVTYAQSAIDAVDKEIATSAKDEAKIKLLSENRVELKKTLDAANEELVNAKAELETATRTLGAAAGRS